MIHATRQTIRRSVRMAGLTVALTPCAAEAHLVTTGLGPLYDGAGHFLLSPEDLIPVLALALFAGLRGAEAGRRALFLLPLAWLAGGLAGLLVKDAPAGSVAAISFLGLGVLVASDLRISATAVAAVTVGLGVLHGFFNGAAMRPAGTGVMELVGVMATVFLLVAPVAAFVVSLKPPWTRIVVRVAGSWIAAIGLLLLGWSMREAWKGSNARMAMLPGRQATAMAEPSAVQLTGKSERAKGKPRRGWRERQTVGHAASKTRVNGKRADLRKPGPAEAPLSQDETLA